MKYKVYLKSGVSNSQYEAKDEFEASSLSEAQDLMARFVSETPFILCEPAQCVRCANIESFTVVEVDDD